MTRVLLFLLPIILFLIYLHYWNSKKGGEGLTDEAMGYFRWGFVALAIVFAGVVVHHVFVADPHRDQVYVPPQEVDGKLEPGRFEDKK